MTEAKVVDEYTIRAEVSPQGFSSVVVNFKDTDGKVTSYAFPPAYAHKLSDELCIASARAAQKSTGEASGGSERTTDADDLSDETTETGSAG